jgi:hypothetical protein
VITTDGYASYTIYNYGQLSWYENGKSYALYNGGDGIKYLILPGSLTNDILKLTNLSNIGIPGKWVFNSSIYSSASTTVTLPTSSK